MGGYRTTYGPWKPMAGKAPTVSAAAAQTKCSGNAQRADYERCMNAYGFARSSHPGCKPVSFF